MTKEALLVYLEVAEREISRTPGKRLAVVEKYLDQGLLDLRVHGEGMCLVRL